MRPLLCHLSYAAEPVIRRENLQASRAGVKVLSCLPDRLPRRGAETGSARAARQGWEGRTGPRVLAITGGGYACVTRTLPSFHATPSQQSRPSLVGPVIPSRPAQQRDRLTEAGRS